MMMMRGEGVVGVRPEGGRGGPATTTTTRPPAPLTGYLLPRCLTSSQLILYSLRRKGGGGGQVEVGKRVEIRWGRGSVWGWRSVGVVQQQELGRAGGSVQCHVTLYNISGHLPHLQWK